MRFPKDYLMVLSKRRGLAAGVFCTVIGVTLALILFLPKRYEAESTILLDSQANVSAAGAVLSDLVGGSSGPSPETEARVVTARPNVQEVIEKLKLDTRPEDLEKDVRATHPKQTDLIMVSGDGDSPQQAADIVNALVAAYIQNLHQRNEREANDTASDVMRRLREVEQKLNRKDKDLAMWLQSHGYAVPEDELKAKIEALGTLQAALAEAEMARTGFSAEAKAIQGGLEGIAPTIRQSETWTSSPVVDELETKLHGLYAKRADTLTEFKSDQPEVKQLDSQIEEVQRLLTQTMAKSIGGLFPTQTQDTSNPVRIDAIQRLAQCQAAEMSAKARAQESQKAMGTIRRELARVPTDSAELGKLRREQLALTTVWGGLMSKYEQLRVQSYAAAIHPVVIEPAYAPLRMARPRPFLYSVVGLLLAIVLAITACLAMENIDRRVSTPHDLEVLGIPSLGNYARDLPPMDADRLWGRLTLNGAASDWHVLAVVPMENQGVTAQALADAARRQGKSVELVTADNSVPAAWRNGSDLVILDLPPMNQSPAGCTAIRQAERVLLDVQSGASAEKMRSGPLGAMAGISVPVVGAAIFEGREVRG